MRPNLFNFATSELSQDGFLCWLLSWAKADYEKENPLLHLVGKDFLNLIYQRAGAALQVEFSNVEIRKQDGNIDILCLVNGKEKAILIEDKVGTKQHSNQLEIYKEYVTKTLGFASDNVISVYIQTGDQSDYSEVLKQGYLVFERKDLLVILENVNGKAARLKSDILDDFSNRLRKIEDSVQSFLNLPPEQWGWNAWKGFYAHLQNTLKAGGWDYVANPSGGFLGFWWYFRGNVDYQLNLQIEYKNKQRKFCFRICVKDATKRRAFRQHLHNMVVVECLKHKIKAKRPDHFGSGKYMTVALLDQPFPAIDSKGLLDMQETIKIIYSAQAVLDACLSTVKAEINHANND